MKYISLFSGVEAASLAWGPLGWEPVAFAEIEPFPAAVLAARWPDVPNLGDITKVDWRQYRGAADVVVGGSPCQSFSVAGLRGGLDDPRGNLALEYLRAVDAIRPTWVVWENVPGALSSGRGRDFGAILGALGQLGYGFAWRVLDAQYFGVPQRRRRVFVVGYLGDWRRAAAVLFEPESLRGDITPRKETRESVASFAPSSLGGYSEGIGTLRANGGDLGGGSETLITNSGDLSFCLNAGGMGRQDSESETLICSFAQNQLGEVRVGKVANTINTNSNASGRNGMGIADVDDPMYTLETRQPHGVLTPSQVRRLTPRECERLQGMRDDHTRISWRGKPAEECPDGPRYKAVGNSMAVPVMRWIGERMAAVET